MNHLLSPGDECVSKFYGHGYVIKIDIFFNNSKNIDGRIVVTFPAGDYFKRNETLHMVAATYDLDGTLIQYKWNGQSTADVGLYDKAGETAKFYKQNKRYVFTEKFCKNV